MNEQATQNLQISPAPNLSWRDVHGELVIVEIDNGKYHVFNETANLIWNAIVANGSSEQAVNRVVSQYEVEQHTAQADVTEFLNQLRERNLVNYS